MVEYWDLYNKERKKIDRIHTRGEPLEQGTYHIVVNVWIVNSKNEVLITQRHPQKKLWGGLWECSASGAVIAGEDSLQGALRETKEEIGIDLFPSEAILIETIFRKDDIRDTFLFKKDIRLDDLIFHPDEVINAKWVSKVEYDDLCNKELMAPPVKNFWELLKNAEEQKVNDHDNWLDWAMELQAIAQNGLTYTKDIYDKERFERIREISAEIMSKKTSLSLDIVKNVFCNETGYQTPKLDIRAAIFCEGKILLVKEKEKWSLPGGWVDCNESIRSNTVKEVKEEAGLDVEPVKIIAVQDRNQHNEPKYAYGICKIFVLCSIIGGAFQTNIETTESAFFSLDSIPVLATEKTTLKQIKMCFEAQNNPNWNAYFD